VLVIGSRAPHKNMDFLLGLEPRLREAGLRLAIAGADDPRIFRDGGRSGDASTVIWLGRVPDGVLAGLLTSCLCLAFPSLTEGFGLPPLEAMALGCPVVVSDRGSLPEICSDGALYASPGDANLWLAHFQALRDDSDLRERMIRFGRGSARRYRWEDTALGYLACMARLDEQIARTSLRTSIMNVATRPGEIAVKVHHLMPCHSGGIGLSNGVAR
jgi:glycosyltransferase involved in cell wall biosynthesis